MGSAEQSNPNVRSASRYSDFARRYPSGVAADNATTLGSIAQGFEADFIFTPGVARSL